MLSDNENPGAEISAGQSATAATPAPKSTSTMEARSFSFQPLKCKSSRPPLPLRLPRSLPPLQSLPPNLLPRRMALPPSSIPM